MGFLKYPFYFICSVFVVLTVYSLSTEKPRQYKAKPVDEAQSKPMSDLWSADETLSTALTDKPAPQASKPATSKSSNSEVNSHASTNQSAASNTNVVVAYSNNDAGGKIVLTLNKCEKLPGSVAYTTAPDGKVDYGCWTFDELYIVIHWDKAGMNNYTYDRFVDMNNNERLLPKHLFEVIKDTHINDSPKTPSVPTQSIVTGGKK